MPIIHHHEINLYGQPYSTEIRDYFIDKWAAIIETIISLELRKIITVV